MGFELPDPDKKKGRFNNRKMSYDRECRQLLLDICKKHGLEIEEEPVYGGRAYMEKQDYIVDKLNTKAADMQEMLDDTQAFIDEMADIAYEKACEVIIDKVAEETAREHISLMNRLRKWLESENCKVPEASRKFGIKVLNTLQDKLNEARIRIISAVRNALHLPDVKKAYRKELTEEIKPSIHGLISKAKERVAEYDRNQAKEIRKKARTMENER